MSELNKQKEQFEKSIDYSKWCYISGRLSVMETRFLDRSFFESLAKCLSFGDVQSMLSKTVYRTYFTYDETVMNYSATLEQAFDDIMDGIFKDSPPHIMRLYFAASKRYVDFRNLFIRLCNQNAPATELENAFDVLVETDVERDAIASHRDMVKIREAPQNADPVARSLFLDSVLTTLKLRLASHIQEMMITTLLRDTAILESWAAILRSRWNGTDPEIVQKWFIVPDEYGNFVRNTVLSAGSNPALALAGVVSEMIASLFRGIDIDILKQNIDLLVRDAVHADVINCRMVTYGPEKVLAFYNALQIEIENLQLALASIVSSIESRIVIERFRREYA